MLARSRFVPKLTRFFGKRPGNQFSGSANYWEGRYSTGGNSGKGSYGELANFKAEVLNSFIQEHQIDSLIEFGCGDGNQLGLLNCPSYTGIDVSATAIGICTQKYGGDPTKRFLLASSVTQHPKATMAMSLDVIYHLIEDKVFDVYITTLFDSADRYVVIYSSNGDPMSGHFSWPPHILHRTFTDWVDRNATDWKLIKKVANRYPYSCDRKGNESGSFADFYLFEKAR